VTRAAGSVPIVIPEGERMPGRQRPRAAGERLDSVRAGFVVAALGVVFGDIGTSPIYTLQTLFNPGDPHPISVTSENVYGVVSLVFWSVVIIVMVTYVLLAMRADNDGEGGILALITLLRRYRPTAEDPKKGPGLKLAAFLVGLGLFGAALFLGDSMITPAISVLSAVEGVRVIQPSLDRWVVPITALIIVVLFLLQRRGTATVGRLFGPVMALWFVVVGAAGVRGIFEHPAILRALLPSYALGFLAGHFGIAFFALSAVVLAVTGAEALYADMGHFGRRSITRAWLFLVFPALVLNYMGQGALILKDPGNVSGPFFLLAPGWGQLPIVLLATAATVIASQSVITGAYSVTSQAAQLGYLPRLRVRHTSTSHIGQIYVPWINWFLLVSVLLLVFAFRSSTALAFAYGMAVTGTITITTLMFFYVARIRWRTPVWLLTVGAVLLLTVDLLFFGANLTKLVHGAWIPLVVGLVAFIVMTTWQKGREIVTDERNRREGPLQDFIEYLRQHPEVATVVPGTAVFPNRGKLTVPLALRANVEHNHVRHEHVVLVSVNTEPVPRVREEDRIEIDDLGYADDGIVHVTVRCGYMETPDLPQILAALDPNITGGSSDLRTASYFLSRIELQPGDRPTMARWRKRLFIATSHATADAVEHFRLPRDATVVIGSRIDV
jgi:KUP system potassium uptake protein